MILFWRTSLSVLAIGITAAAMFGIVAGALFFCGFASGALALHLGQLRLDDLRARRAGVGKLCRVPRGRDVVRVVGIDDDGALRVRGDDWHPGDIDQRVDPKLVQWVEAPAA